MKDKAISGKKAKQKNKVENKRRCGSCKNAEKTYRMICMDGANTEDRLVCLNCGAGMPAPFN